MSRCLQSQCSEELKFVFIGKTIRRLVFMHSTVALEVLVSIEELEVMEGTMASKQLKMLLGWAAFHQEELWENWELARAHQELFAIEPLK